MPLEDNEPASFPSDDKKMESDYLFVYGGLKRGGVYHSNLEGAEFVGECMSRKAKYALFTPNDAWPILYKGNYRIKGELYKIDQKLRDRLDWVEGHPNLFTRVMFKIRSLKGLVYVYKGSDRLIKTYEDVKYNSDYIITDEQNHTQEWILP